MTINNVLETLIRIFDEASIAEIKDAGVQEGILNGETDLVFDEIEMDSLACMEVCIGIEIETGVSISPDELNKMGSLQKVAKSIISKL